MYCRVCARLHVLVDVVFHARSATTMRATYARQRSTHPEIEVSIEYTCRNCKNKTRFLLFFAQVFLWFFRVECVSWAYLAEYFSGHRDVCVCVNQTAIFNVTSQSVDTFICRVRRPTSYQWHCKQFSSCHTVFFSLTPSPHFLPFSFIRFPLLVQFFARFNYDFKVCARHHMNVNDCGYNHCYPVLNAFRNYYTADCNNEYRKQKAWMNRLNRSSGRFWLSFEFSFFATTPLCSIFFQIFRWYWLGNSETIAHSSMAEKEEVEKRMHLLCCCCC